MKVLGKYLYHSTRQEREWNIIEFAEDLESPNEPRIHAGVIDFVLKGKRELTIIGCALRLGRLSTIPSSIIFVE